jgi:hypothetical protein
MRTVPVFAGIDPVKIAKRSSGVAPVWQAASATRRAGRSAGTPSCAEADEARATSRKRRTSADVRRMFLSGNSAARRQLRCCAYWIW